ncbi:hypothetical protein VA7868_03137 [Vibrio aerogenes CECT 7868]|uniref:Uncharacterized protein n=1 Tax=Vibrio aerogenes CECT 7868 TaxID=1216006 RepID=A0A1M5ZSL9_9VIBR|nr:hypothetical protein [Vibrio aerogenes]SHI27086.1 hypothetical protein VA7868_03137 [Vibrio aerogenes CECT 7868]
MVKKGTSKKNLEIDMETLRAMSDGEPKMYENGVELHQHAPQTLESFYQRVKTLAQENKCKRNMYQLFKTCYEAYL